MGKKKYDNGNDNFHLLPLLVLEDVVVLPSIPHPVKIEEVEKIELVNKVFSENSDLVVGWSPQDSTIYDNGKIMSCAMVCHVDKVLQMPGAPTLAFMIPRHKVIIHAIEEKEDALWAQISPLSDIALPKRRTSESKYLEERLNKLFDSLIGFISPPEKANAETMIKDFSRNPVEKIYAMANMAPISPEEKYQLLICDTFPSLINSAVINFDQALQRINLQAAIHEKTHREISQQQKEAFLRLHMKHIKEELGETGDDDDIAELLTAGAKKKWAPEVDQHFKKEISKLRKLNISSPEYSVQYSYLENFLALPWDNYSHVNLSLKSVQEILDRDHFGLQKVKDRIIEHMAVLKLRKDLKAPIICLYGPPGVGKTSIGKSVAEALGREYIRISLGGMHDEAEIRGHRRTYIGAMPGRFLQSLSKGKTGNPLILLDEIDKVGKDYKGDPSSALLEALDPEQNNTFHDNFIDYPYDLSKVLFIATANDLSTIPAPLLDRMEIIEMSGYIPEEKKEIALRHLVRKVLKDSGFKEDEISFTPEAIDHIIRFYTREAGVRQLEKKIGKIIRKIARLKASRKSFPRQINPSLVEDYLGKHEINPDAYEGNDFAGVATGLAWTPVGGEILFIETSLSPGKGEKLTLTGNLGDVMKESAVIALQYLKANARQIGIDPEIFSKTDIHIHVPEGAVPKDGPSAGVTIATSMASAFLGKKMRDRMAMTGEITLRGKVLPVGGIKEKIIAARQAGIKHIILSKENEKDIEEIPSIYLEGLDFTYITTLKELFSYALTDEPALYQFEITQK